MKIGVISDTHDSLISLKKAIEIFEENKVKLILHCGDWVSPYAVEFLANNTNLPIKGVIGNNIGDIKRTLERNIKLSNQIIFPEKGETLALETEGKKIIIYHGEDKEVLQSLIFSKRYDIVLTGHTHIIRNEIIDDILVVNPGTTSYASGGKIIDFASVAILDTSTKSAEIIKF